MDLHLNRIVMLCFVLTGLLLYGECNTGEQKRRRHVKSQDKPLVPELSRANLEKAAQQVLSAVKVEAKPGVAGKLPQRLSQRLEGAVQTGNPFNLGLNCERESIQFRTITGTCNNLLQPFLGGANTPQPRLLPNRYEDGIQTVRTTYFLSGGQLPSARTVSLNVHRIDSNTSSGQSHLLMNFGQFLDHDLVLTPEGREGAPEEMSIETCCNQQSTTFNSVLGECFPIMVESGDPTFTTSCIPFLRSSQTVGLPNAPAIRHQLNDLTSYIDASQVYGSSQSVAQSLRTFRNGKLKSLGFGGSERLPLDEESQQSCFSGAGGCHFLSGDIRNSEQAGLTSMHTLFLREHNKLADEFQNLNPSWTDERIYQTTRKVIGAISQRITYTEFLPQILGSTLMRHYQLVLPNSGRFTGYNPTVDPSVFLEFSTAAFRFGHSLVRSTFSNSPSMATGLESMFNSFETMGNFGCEGILRGLITDGVANLDQFLTAGLRDNLFGGQLDLAALNIQRGRDHGIASYNDVRRFLGLTAYGSYAEIVTAGTHTQESANALEAVYPTPDDMELFPAAMSEVPLSEGMIGETFGHLIGLQFQRLRFGDRFWHETPDTETGFTTDQLAEIRKVTMASLFCRNIQGVTVRRQLMMVENAQNPTQPCSLIPKMHLGPWRKQSSNKRRKKPRRPSKNKKSKSRKSLKQSARNHKSGKKLQLKAAKPLRKVNKKPGNVKRKVSKKQLAKRRRSKKKARNKKRRQG